jgi:hypothetical protein
VNKLGRFPLARRVVVVIARRNSSYEDKPMPSQNYDAIAGCIALKVPFKASYAPTVDPNDPNDPIDAGDGVVRTLYPHALGYKREPPEPESEINERVLCWQGDPAPACWRCYSVSKLRNIQMVPATFLPRDDYSRHQGCVQNVRQQVRR